MHAKLRHRIIALLVLGMLQSNQAWAHPWIERAVNEGFRELSQDPDIPFRAWIRRVHAATRLIVIIESDGAAWKAAGFRPPENPTSRHPIGLHMALISPAQENVLYLARPCQFIGRGDLSNFKNDSILSKHQQSSCLDKRWWTLWRYRADLIDRYAKLIEEQVSLHRETAYRSSDQGVRFSLVLAGFSGGGTVAALLTAAFAAQDFRIDPNNSETLVPGKSLCLITLAAPLDLNRWALYHRLSLYIDVPSGKVLAERIAAVRSFHAFGGRDRKVPLESAGEFLLTDDWRDRVHHYAELAHDASWAMLWPDLLQEACGYV